MKQLHINLSGKELKDSGILKAEINANRVNPGWSEQAYDYLKIFIRHRRTPFTIESFRASLKSYLPDPPSLRAFGALAVRAKREGLIKRVGFVQVENPKAHQANANLWMKI